MSERAVIPWSGPRFEVRRLAGLAWPVSLAYIGNVTLGTVDVMMAGRLGATTLAAVALGSMWHIAVGILAFGASRALDPIVAQAFGAGDRRAAGLGLSRGFAMAAILSVPMMAGLTAAGPALRALGQPEELLADAAGYNLALIGGVPALLGFAIVRQFLAALGRMREATVAIVLANAVNALLNWVFMYGNLGVPPLGAIGCAISTAIGEWFMLGAIVWLSRRTLASFWPGTRGMFEAGPLRRLFAIGLPLGVQFALEVWAFHAAVVLMGRFGKETLGGYQIAINLATLSFMLPNGLGAAAATRVGNLVGAGHAWARSAWVAVGLGAAIMTVPAAAFVGLPELLARAYTPDAGVLFWAVAFLPLVGAFQLFDGIQVVCFGALRGAGDVHVPAIANVVGYWLVGLPAGAWFAFRGGAGPRGVWYGLVLALGIVALLLLFRLATVARRGATRVRLDSGPASP